MKNNKLENGAIDHFMVTMCKKTNKQTKKKKKIRTSKTYYGQQRRIFDTSKKWGIGQDQIVK